MTPPTLQQAIAEVQQLPTLPGSSRQVLEYLNDETADTNKIVRAIECDQGLVVRILRMANSPFFGLPAKVKNIKEAVVVLGFANLRMVVISAMLTAQKFPNLVNDPRVHAIFRHGLAVAIAASVIARNNRLDANLLFLAGILHDIGALALMSSYPELYAEVEQYRIANDLLPYEAEQKVFGFDHSTVGAALCRHWNLPEAISQALEDHHHAENQPPTTEDTPEPPRHELFAGVIHIADAIAHGLNLDNVAHPTIPPISDALWFRLAGRQEQLIADLAEIENMYWELLALIDG
jgi:putative nucleotidyltransferase with HDIG domain